MVDAIFDELFVEIVVDFGKKVIDAAVEIDVQLTGLEVFDEIDD